MASRLGESPLFSARIEAWANGPVAPELYKRHTGNFSVTDWTYGDAAHLGTIEKSTVEAIVDFYGGMSGFELSQLTHREDPWKDARKEAGLAPGDRGTAVITHAAMAEYYGGLVEADAD